MALTKVGKEGITGISNSSDATAITIDSSENVTFAAATRAPNSSASAPAYAFSNDTSSGLFLPGADKLGFAAGGAEMVRFDTGQVRVNTASAHPSGTGTTPVMHIDVNGTSNTPSGAIGISGLASSEVALSILPGFNVGYYGAIFMNSSASNVGTIYSDSSSTAYNTSSDYRLKENVVDITGAITRVKQLAPKRFNFIIAPEKTVDGFLAHEAQAVVPESVTGEKDEVDDNGKAVIQGIDQAKLVPLLTAALKESIAKIETLETEMTALKARVTALEA